MTQRTNVRIGRSPSRCLLLIKAVVQFGLVIFWINIANAISKFSIEASAGSSISPSLSTRVTGFGSRRSADISSIQVVQAERATKPLSIFLGHANNADQDYILLHSEPHNSTLQILQDGSVVRHDSNYTPASDATETWAKVIGLFGVYRVPSGHIWVWIVDAERIYEAPYLSNRNSSASDRHLFPWWSLHRVTQLHLAHLPFSNYSSAHASMKHYRAQQREEKRQLALLRQALKDHDWYYSEGSVAGDLTRRLQDSLGLENGSSSSKAAKQLPDERFFWNQAVVNPFLEKYRQHNLENDDKDVYEILLEHAIPITSAFCGTQTNISVSPDGSSRVYDQVLVTRRSRFRAGTRFTRRGADASGAVANFAETEQILFFWNQTKEDVRILENVCSHVQTRGSIPLRWSSPTDIKTYRPRVRIGTNPLAHARALRQHLADQAQYFATASSSVTEAQKNPRLLLVNLVDKKSDQGRLGRAFDAVLKAVLDVYAQQPDKQMQWLAPGQVVHLWFDFHAEVKAGGYDRLSSLLDEVKPTLDQHGYFEAVPSHESQMNHSSDSIFRIKRVQMGVVRTNCMDCLDRTNVVQSQFARHVLFSQVVAASKVPVSYKSIFRQKSSVLPWLTGEVAHRLLWADNADAISRLYAGTPALKGDFTRTGKRTKKGALEDGMNSLQRYYLNNFLDADRQEGIDLLTGHHPFNKLASLLDDFREIGETRSSSLGAEKPLNIDLIQEVGQRSRKKFSFATSKKDSIRKATKTTEITFPFQWLPGDLQSHVWNLYPRLRNSSMNSASTFAFEGVHRRGADLLPWWCVNSDAQDQLIGHDDIAAEQRSSFLAEAEISALNNAGYILGALAVALHRPQSLAIIVAMLVEVTDISGPRRRQRRSSEKNN